MRIDVEGSSRRDMFLVPPEKVQIVGLDTLDGPEHPLYDERVKLPVTPEQVANVRRYGVLVPVELRKDGKVLQVVTGRQRVRWARAANEADGKAGGKAQLIRAFVRDQPEEDIPGTVLAENEIRQADDIPSKARKVSRLHELHGLSIKDIAVACGVGVPTVRSWLGYHRLDPAVQQEVRDGTVSATAAVKLAGRSRAEQKQKLEEVKSQVPPGGKIAVRHMADATSSTPPKRKRPGIRTIKLVLATRPPPDVVRALEWVLGDIDDPPWAVLEDAPAKAPPEDPRQIRIPGAE